MERGNRKVETEGDKKKTKGSVDLLNLIDFDRIIARINIKVNQEDVVKTQKWIDFCKEICQEFEVCVVRDKDLNICIAGIDENVASAQMIIKKFLDDNELHCASGKELDMPTQSRSAKIISSPEIKEGRKLGQKENPKSSKFQPVEQAPDFEPNIILLSGLNKITSHKCILNFVEAKTKEKVLVILKSDDKTSAFIIFENIIDFKNAKERMECRSLDGRRVTVHRVPVSWGVTSIQYEEGKEEAVTFKDPDAMQNFLSSSLKVDDAEELNLKKQFFEDMHDIFITELHSSPDKVVRRYIFEHRKEELVKMEKDYSVRIIADEKELDKILINGTKVGCSHAQEALQSLESSVSTKKMKVQQPGLQKLVTSGKLDKLVRNIEHEHKCAIAKVENTKQLEGSIESKDAASQAMFARASVTDGFKSDKCGNVTISWKPGNIVTEHVGIQVGSTIGKLFDIFIEAGGPELTKELTRYDKSNDYVITSKTGNLPCDHVILASCCRWDGGKGEKILRSIVRDCLQQASKLNARSIAFPIIGTGGLGFPYDKACQIMINEVKTVTCQWGPTSVNDIRFVVFDQHTKFSDAFQQEFTPGDFNKEGGQESRFAQSKKLVNAFQQEPPIYVAEKSGRDSSIRAGWKSLRESTRRIPSTSIRNVFGKVAVDVLEGNLVDQKTDAIVNISATDMNLQNAGALSKAIAAAAGPAVQTECTKKGKQTAGSAVITGAGKLKAKKIIHMIPGEASVQHMQKCIENCLQTAENSRFQSISIPACGTGGFKMSADDSAQATFQALANVCSNLKHLRQIRIVIFQSQLLSAFMKKLGEYVTRASNKIVGESVQPGKSLRNTRESRNADEATTATIILSVYGKNTVVDEAMAELNRELTEACKTSTIEDESISRLSEDQRKALTGKANDHGVEIKFGECKIEFRGNPEDILKIHDQCWKDI